MRRDRRGGRPREARRREQTRDERATERGGCWPPPRGDVGVDLSAEWRSACDIAPARRGAESVSHEYK
jgi:hypothetical protein